MKANESCCDSEWPYEVTETQYRPGSAVQKDSRCDSEWPYEVTETHVDEQPEALRLELR